MFDEDDKQKPAQEFPRNLENLSVLELEDYIQDLKAEIERVEGDRTQKKASQDAAAAIFKS